jgi:hypothetical protein
MWSMPSTTTSIDGGERRSSKGSITRAYSPDWKLYTGFAGLCLLVLAAAIDGTVLVAGLPVNFFEEALQIDRLMCVDGHD